VECLFLQKDYFFRTLDDLDPVLFLNPFLDVIRCEVVTGPVTGQALVRSEDTLIRRDFSKIILYYVHRIVFTSFCLTSYYIAICQTWFMQ